MNGAKDVMEVHMRKRKDLLYKISDKDKKAYETYLALTSYSNIGKYDKIIKEARQDYAKRDLTFPVSLVVKG